MFIVFVALGLPFPQVHPIAVCWGGGGGEISVLLKLYLFAWLFQDGGS